MCHAKEGWIHGADEGWEDGWKRTYADAYTEGRSESESWAADADANGWAVDGGLVVLLFDDDLLAAAVAGSGSAGGRGVERGWWRVAVKIGVIGDVGEPGTAGH
jgi:hypothetical protein|tara:strand:- start:1680 stop:1991 length:312 start_codon:yes stop_codon:yes gene_type:complete